MWLDAQDRGEAMTNCMHRWKKWEKEQHIYGVSIYSNNESMGYFQRRECKTCGMAEWKPVAVTAKEQPQP